MIHTLGYLFFVPSSMKHAHIYIYLYNCIALQMDHDQIVPKALATHVWVVVTFAIPDKLDNDGRLSKVAYTLQLWGK